jgi:hypothetical protein
MTLLTMTIPDDPAELAAWLEQRLMAPDFGRFVTELSAMSTAAPGERQPARQLLGDWLPHALTSGLRELPPQLLRRLLRQPATLADLQEIILTEGGGYWDSVLRRSDELTAAFDRGKGSLGAIVAPGPAAVKTRPDPVPATLPFRPRERRYRLWAWCSTAAAACLAVIVGVLLWRAGQPTEAPPAIAWGWAKPSGIPAKDVPPREYLDKLADAAEEWFKKRPEDAAGVAKRLNEFRSGCSQLILAAHEPLTPADRDWLVERCRVWAGKLDGHLTALEAGREPLQVREEADKTVTALVKALRDRAAQV